MDIKPATGGICAAKGFSAGGIHCGIRHNKQKPDLAMIISDTECAAAAVYTQNKVAGAPILVTKKNIANGHCKAMLCNSGNANTCNPDGVEIAETCCRLAAEATGLKPDDFIIASTGVIGQALPLAPFKSGIPAVAASLQANAGGSHAAATAIMTTDTAAKEYAVEFEIDGKTCRLGAIGKGSGMINPNMATMLIFVTTDAAISPAMLGKALSEATTVTFNQISVDGDTSTNDMVSVMANGMAQNNSIDSEGPAYDTFYKALHDVCLYMSREIARDGEGATKLIECHVQNASSAVLARKIAKTVISSDLVKTAIFGSDANWGRVLCAIGYTPGDFPIQNVAVRLKSAAGEVLVCENAAHYPFSEETAAKVLAESEIQILIDMGSGDACGSAWGCDLTYDYVRINGDYRT